MSKIIRTIGDLICEKDYDYIEYREMVPICGRIHSVFMGEAASKDGKLISLDGDSYSEDCKIHDYHEWSAPEKGINTGLTVRVLHALEVKEMKNCDLVTCTANENGKCANRGYADSCPYAKCKRILEDIREYVDRYDRENGNKERR